ncbi:MAG: hypothetical protein U0800_05120 [Isosphaeraceae bacterium]
MRSSTIRRAGRRGFASVEVEVAFAVLGIGLAGLFPVVYSQLRIIEHIERQVVVATPVGCGYDPTRTPPTATVRPGPPATRVDRWARRLGRPPSVEAWEDGGSGAHVINPPDTPPDPAAGDYAQDVGLLGMPAIVRDPGTGVAKSLSVPVQTRSNPH